MRATSQLLGRWPTDVDDPPDLHINKKSDYNDDMIWFTVQYYNKMLDFRICFALFLLVPDLG